MGTAGAWSMAAEDAAEAEAREFCLCFDGAIAFLGQIMMRQLHAWLTGTPEGGTVAPCAVDLYAAQAHAFLDHFDTDMQECLTEQVCERLRCVPEMRRGDGVSAAEAPSAG